MLSRVCATQHVFRLLEETAVPGDRGSLSLKRELLRDGTVTPDGTAAGPGASEPRLFSHGKLKVPVLA